MDLILIIIILLLLFGGGFGYSRYGYRGGIGIGGILLIVLILYLLLGHGRKFVSEPMVHWERKAHFATLTYSLGESWLHGINQELLRCVWIFKTIRKRKYILNEPVIKKRNSYFQSMSH